MGRKKKRRLVEGLPDAVFFKPQGVPMKALQRLAISIEGFEALRLVDGEGMLQQEAAERMGVSRPTLSRILAEARKGVATALSNGWAIEIEGGAYHCLDEVCPKRQPSDQGEAVMPNMDGTGPGGGRGGGRGMGRGTGMGRRQGGQGCVVGAGRGQGGQGRGMGPCGQAGMGGAGMGQGQGGQGNRQRTRTILQDNANTAIGGTVKKIAITSEGPTLDDRVDPRFGRAAGFVIVDLETMETSYIDNGATQTMSQGAGIQAAENVANAGAGALLTGYVGPKAFSALSAAGIQIIQDVDGMSVGEAVAKFKSGKVAVADAPNAAGGAHK